MPPVVFSVVDWFKNPQSNENHPQSEDDVENKDALQGKIWWSATLTREKRRRRESRHYTRVTWRKIAGSKGGILKIDFLNNQKITVLHGDVCKHAATVMNLKSELVNVNNRFEFQQFALLHICVLSTVSKCRLRTYKIKSFFTFCTIVLVIVGLNSVHIGLKIQDIIWGKCPVGDFHEFLIHCEMFNFFW